MISNAFHLRPPVEITVEFRVRADAPDWTAGLLFVETPDQTAGLRATANRVRLDNGSTNLSSGATTPADLQTDKVYRMSVRLSAEQRLQTHVTDPSTGETVAQMNGQTAVDPSALGLFVHTDARSSTVIDYDAVSVDAAPYRVYSSEWSRSPQYVVLPRGPELEQEQGNWVGAQSTMKKDGRYLMWYRIRSNDERGVGYGFAESEDGLNWSKHEETPIFTHDPKHRSNEKISVLHVDGQYQAWYTVDEADGPWKTAYATSEDGVHWAKQGIVIDDTYNKDPVVLYREGTYYLYAIAPERDEVGIYTSSDGVDWRRRRTLPMGVHRHMAATYAEEPGEFHLYLSGGHLGVSRAVSANGLDFGLFERVWGPSTAGLDDWDRAGLTYLSFVTDEHGHVPDAHSLPVYYQARNDLDNNIPGWRYHGSERIVLGGRFEGLYLGIPSDVHPDGRYAYHRFPFEAPRARGLEVRTSQRATITLDRWNRDHSTLGAGTLAIPEGQAVQTQVQWHLEGLNPGRTYKLCYNGSAVAEGVAGDAGALNWTTLADSSDIRFEIQRNP